MSLLSKISKLTKDKIGDIVYGRTIKAKDYDYLMFDVFNLKIDPDQIVTRRLYEGTFPLDESQPSEESQLEGFNNRALIPNLEPTRYWGQIDQRNRWDNIQNIRSIINDNTSDLEKEREELNAKLKRGLPNIDPQTKQPVYSNALQSVISQMKEREQLGLAKYGTTVDRTDLNLLEWLEHLKQELMDAVLYIEAAKRELTIDSKTKE